MNAQSAIEAAAVPAVYTKIAAVQAALAKTGISKSRRNQQQGYQFRGIDEIYDALAPLLAETGLCILPRMISRSVNERQTAKGGVLFYVTVEAEFDFIAVEDGSLHVVRTFGEAMDSADKATNKAMSAAYKYAALMTFAIPTEGDNDADANTHEVQPRNEQQRQNAPEQISEHQWSRIISLLEHTNSNADAILKHFKVPDLKKLTAAQAIKSINQLEDKLAAMTREETNRAGQAGGSDFGNINDSDIPF